LPDLLSRVSNSIRVTTNALFLKFFFHFILSGIKLHCPEEDPAHSKNKTKVDVEDWKNESTGETHQEHSGQAQKPVKGGELCER